MPPDDDATAPKLEDAAAAPAAPAEAPAPEPEAAAPPPLPETAGPVLDFGPDHQAERYVDAEVVAEGDVVTVGEFAEAIKGVAIVKGDDVRDLDTWSAEPLAVGASKVTAKGLGSGPVTVRLRLG